jgi:hypothetical protein
VLHILINKRVFAVRNTQGKDCECDDGRHSESENASYLAKVDKDPRVKLTGRQPPVIDLLPFLLLSDPV